MASSWPTRGVTKRRNLDRRDDDAEVSGDEAVASSPGEDLLRAYDVALPRVYGYLLARCGDAGIAEELTAETFLAAVDAVRRERPPPVSTPWLIGVARHKLADHWRRRSREERLLTAVGRAETVDDPWEAALDAVRARAVLAGLATPYRAALTLRYLDDLTVPQVADLLGRSVQATEAVLMRAKASFRAAYDATEPVDPEGSSNA
jgi:RNA polymerase sigma-70 factor (ECF subfamily)